MDGQRFFVAKTYVTESKAREGYCESAWRVCAIADDGTVRVLDDYYDNEGDALDGAVQALRG